MTSPSVPCSSQSFIGSQTSLISDHFQNTLLIYSVFQVNTLAGAFNLQLFIRLPCGRHWEKTSNHLPISYGISSKTCPIFRVSNSQQRVPLSMKPALPDNAILALAVAWESSLLTLSNTSSHYPSSLRGMTVFLLSRSWIKMRGLAFIIWVISYLY